ncbi:DUF1232 domain-containing protein [Stigmatella sp. ncwal1]|uniref:DUF1232 domain-containing protein n=1 Tax=Stigmatella ashevillensis TaxID=2995309 RepID=A0ABT5DCI8_9BACT|nr:DUF1232 domain-containing protein [Stigmatella ashevillena]MDC0710825.1 DUF1232 domain-containing protein [Stigmatella ashevillena]
MNVTGLRGMGTRFFGYLRDGRVPLWKKLTGVFAVLYFLSPVDAIPDVLPLLGWLDDLGVLSAAAFYMVRQVQQYRPVPDVEGVPKDLNGRPRLPSSRGAF